MALMTVFTGVCGGTSGVTFTHGLTDRFGTATTPDYCTAVLEVNTNATSTIVAVNVTFNSATVTVWGGFPGAQVRVICEKIHSIMYGP